MQGVKRLLIFLAFAGGVWFVQSINPTFDDHADMIQPESMVQQVDWDNLIYSDLFFLSLTKSAKTQTLVSFGFCNYVNVVDDEWAQKNVLREANPFR